MRIGATELAAVLLDERIGALRVGALCGRLHRIEALLKQIVNSYLMTSGGLDAPGTLGHGMRKATRAWMSNDYEYKHPCSLNRNSMRAIAVNLSRSTCCIPDGSCENCEVDTANVPGSQPASR